MMDSLFKLRPYQKQIGKDAAEILQIYNIVYLAMEPRTGKTATSLEVCRNNNYKRVLFLTKKNALSSIQFDFSNFGFEFDFKLTVINDESLHKIDGKFDVVIHDEHHRFGAFPKPTATAKLFKSRYSKLPMIFLSGTPTAESYSQFYHQFWVSDFSPFKEYKSFYKWADKFVNVTKEWRGQGLVNNYKDARYNDFRGMIRRFMFTFTKVQAGFKTAVNETVFEIDMLPNTVKMMTKLRKDKVLISATNGSVILADTGAKMMAKIQQIGSGTCILDGGAMAIFDYSKAKYLEDNFGQYKIGIFYKFQAELQMLKNHFGDRITTDLDEFNNSDKWIALQFIAGREGISLKKADYLVCIAIDFSAVTYWQFRDRMTTIERPENSVFFVFAKGGIESKIYQTVLEKKNYTLKIFEDGI